nr:hypothetical protein HmN_000985300 [Hymenolepis microstoma]CUU98154.1 hypothetical transcript [Hymenolepis microstoma]
MIVTENEAVPIEEPEVPEDVNGQLSEISACEKARKEIEEVSSTQSKEGKVKEEVEKAESAVESEEDTEANGDNETDYGKSEVMHNNCENQECVTDDEGNRDESYNESNRASSVNGNSLE